MATLYVSATGSDTNTGTSSAAPWRTIAKANAAVQPGTTVVLTGQFVKEVIAPARSGTASAPITYTGSACLDQPGLVGGSIPYCAYMGARSYVVVDGLTFANSNYVNAPVANKGIVLRSSNHITFQNCVFRHMQVQLIGSSDNTFVANTGRCFVANYFNPATGAPDPNHPQTSGDMINVMLGSHRNVFDSNDFAYGGHSLIQMGNGSGVTDRNANNQITNNRLSNPWYKCLILSDDGDGTIADNNQLLDANSVPTLYSTIAGQVGQLQTASDAVQFSGRNFIFTNNTIQNGVGVYGIISLGSRWYVDSNHPNGVLVESVDNVVADNTVVGNRAAAGLSFIEFLSAADIQAGRTAVPALTGNEISNNTFSNNYATPYSWNGQQVYSTFLYHSAMMAPPWNGYNGNKVTGNTLDGGTANLNDSTYNGKTTHVTQTLAQFEASAPTDVYGNH